MQLESVTEEVYDEAYAQARLFDEMNSEDIAGIPMCGVPVSIKDSVDMKGCDTTVGITARCFKPFLVDGLLVKLLRRAGYIPFVRTNVPQLLLMPESENIVWGQSKNPYDITRTPGGSSGGEGSLIASRCSFLGLGSDIGGSIRIPAHYCGIVGFKPTPGRITKLGAAVPRLNNRNGQIVVPSTTGPMARSVRDCAQMMKALVNQVREEDLTVPAIPWDDNCVQHGRKSRMRVAVMQSDGWFEPFPVCKRAVQIAADALIKAGHEVVQFEQPVLGSDMIRAYFQAMGADGNWYSLLRALEGEELHDSYKSLQAFTKLPNFLRPLVKKMLELCGEHRKALLLGAIKNGGLTVREYWEIVSDVNAIKAAYSDIFSRQGYDALLMPGLGVTALPHGMAPELLSALSYTFLANLLSWPAGTVPVTSTLLSEEIYSVPACEQDSMYRLAAKACLGSTGLPAGVQIMTPQWQDEKCLFLMGEIEKNVKFSEKPKCCSC